MYKRILVATDGSEFARAAIDAAVSLAALASAAVVAVHVRAPVTKYLHGEAAVVIPPEALASVREQSKAASRRYLDEAQAAAQARNVRCEAFDVEDASVAEAVLRTARDQDCDLIVMASHGRGALSRALLGSETNRVLAHATQAVLVTRSGSHSR
jgi:nucleotide-binding universal stress UspA family protein